LCSLTLAIQYLNSSSNNNKFFNSNKPRFGFCVLNFLSILLDFLSRSEPKAEEFAKLQFFER
jgi:hypothetical protein